VGDVIGLDVAVVGNDGSATEYATDMPGYTGMKSENILTEKFNNWAQFGLHKLVNLPGDANGDGMVDVGDLGILAANYGGSGKKWEQGDFNGDGLVDVGDLGILAANYGAGTVTSLDFNKDAKALGLSVDDQKSVVDEETPVTSILGCESIGLPLVVGFALMGLLLVKLEEEEV
jgi:hypothetical protein